MVFLEKQLPKNLSEFYSIRITFTAVTKIAIDSSPYLLTQSTVQSPSWEANWFAASQEFPRISRNPKVHYRTHKRPPPVSILDQPNPVHITTSHLLEVHLNIILPSTPRSPQWSSSLRFPHQDPIQPLSSPIRATCPAHFILLDFITRTIFGEEYNWFLSLARLIQSTSQLPNIISEMKEILKKITSVLIVPKLISCEIKLP